MDHTNPGYVDPAWKTLYRVSGVAALIAVFVFRRYLGAELMAFRGFGLLAVPETMPVSSAEWFTLLQRNTLVGLALLNVFDLIEYTLVGLIFLAVSTALWRTNRAILLVATICGLVGIIVYFASNQAFAMLALSERYGAATTDAQRATFLAAGEALLAINNPGALIQGTGTYASLFLVLLAGLIISIVMLRSNVFSKLTAVTGILANSSALGYFFVLAFVPAMLAIPFIISAPFRITWYFLIARKLFQLGKDG